MEIIIIIILFVKTILNFMAGQKQPAGWTWPVGCGWPSPTSECGSPNVIPGSAAPTSPGNPSKTSDSETGE